jgi:hypothetical protein
LSHEAESRVQLQSVQKFLGISDLPEEQHDNLEGSCQWIDERQDFRDWRDATYQLDMTKETQYSPSIYWVNASPGAGKTVLAAYVSSQLKEFHLQHAVFYFHSGKKASQLLPSFFRSIAFQMARSTAAVRDAMAKLHQDGVTYDLDDARAVWSKVFRAGILQVCCAHQFSERYTM